MTKTNGTRNAFVILAVALSLLGTTLILGLRHGSNQDMVMATDLGLARMECAKARSADRERLSHLESAIFRIDENIKDIKEALRLRD